MTNRKLKLIAGLSVLAVLIIVLLLIGKKKDFHIEHSDFDAIKNSGRLRIATEKSNVGFKIGNKTVDGFNYELVKAFADSMGLELEINLVSNVDSAIYGLWEHKYDLIANNIPNTSDMNNRLNLTVPILTTRQMLIQRNNNDSIEGDSLLEDHHLLKNEKIYLAAGSPFRMRLDNLSNELADTLNIVEVPNLTTEELVKAVSEGKIKFTICDELQARKLSRDFSNIDFSVPVGFNQQFCWAVDKKSEKLRDKLNLFLSDFLISDEFWAIYRKYY